MTYNTVSELLSLAENSSSSLWEIIMENECTLSEVNRDVVFERLAQRYQVMCRSAERALTEPLPSAGGLTDGISSAHYEFCVCSGGISGKFMNLVMARALSCSEVNAAMGKICAAPTAGSCGILPAVLMTVAEKCGSSEREVLCALLTASGIGAIITKNATVAGSEGGCQAECGVAAAMAAAGAVHLYGGSNQMAVNSAGFALINCMGLICDPIAGLVEVPCAQRNASQAVNAIISADLALAGMKSPVSCDEVIEAMYRTGKLLPPQLRETAQGGIAATPSGRKIAKQVFGR